MGKGKTPGELVRMLRDCVGYGLYKERCADDDDDDNGDQDDQNDHDDNRSELAMRARMWDEF